MRAESRLASTSLADRFSTALRAPAKAFAQAVLLVAAIAGTLDIAAAILHIWAASGHLSITVFKGIAGGVFGREHAQQGGAGMMAIGAFFHYFISFVFTLLYFLLVPRLAILRKNAWAAGLVYGLFAWTVMNYVVLPLSALPARAPRFGNQHTYIGIGILMFAFGLPIALGAARFYKGRARL